MLYLCQALSNADSRAIAGLLSSPTMIGRVWYYGAEYRTKPKKLLMLCSAGGARATQHQEFCWGSIFYPVLRCNSNDLISLSKQKPDATWHQAFVLLWRRGILGIGIS